MLKKTIIILAVTSTGILLSVGTVFLLIPSDYIEEHLASAVSQNSGVRMREESFEKVFPFGVESKGISLERVDGAELNIERCFAKFAPFSLFAGRVGINIDCDLYGGGFKGLIARGWGEMVVDLKLRGIDMWKLARAVKSGFHFPGVMDGIVSLRSPYGGCPRGVVRGTGKGSAGDGEKKILYRGLNIPLGRVEEYGVEIEFSGCRAVVKGVWVKGESMSARVSGVVKISNPVERSALDLTLELVPSGSLAEEFNRMVYLRPYRKSATYYAASIKGSLMYPLIIPEYGLSGGGS